MVIDSKLTRFSPFGIMRFGIILLLVCSTAASGASIRLSIGSNELVALETSPVEVKSGEGGEAVFSCDDVRWLGESGEPRIPWKVITMLLPPEADITSVRCHIERPVYEGIEGIWQVGPVPALGSWDEENGQVIIVWPEEKRIVDGRDADIYERDAFWPEKEVFVSGTGSLRKWRLAELAVPLVRYNPVRGELVRLTGAEIAVTFQSRVRALGSDRAETLGRSRVEGMAANFAHAAGAYDKASISSQAVPDGGEVGVASPDSNSTGYVIITTSAIESASSKLGAFVSHKVLRGFDVQVITESEWGGGSGDAAANNIRAWLANNYVSEGILYVLLIGNPRPDTGDVPMKMCISDHPTDYFYAELTRDWDRDGDSIYGEKGSDANNGDEVEKYFEVYVGRIPYYGNMSDLDHILQKTIDYENETDVEWRRNVLLPMVPLGDPTQSYELGEQIKSEHLEPEAITSERIYDKVYDVIPPPEYLRKESYQSYPATVWSRGKYGLNVWMTHGSSKSASGIIKSGETQDLNDSYPTATWQGSCTNSKPEESQNLAYSILKNGGIATAGATRLSWYSVGQTNFKNTSSIGGLGYQYAKRLVERQSCGEALYNTKEARSIWLKNYYVFNLYGDPSVVIFGASPDFTVSPTDMLYQVGPYGGPFNTISYTLRNNSSSAVEWTVFTTAGWLDIPAGGIIGPGGSATVDVLSRTEVYGWQAGRYCGDIIFRDNTNQTEHVREAVLDIKSKLLKGYWRLDETNGTTASDSSGNGFDGTLEGGFSFDTASTAGKFAAALDFGHPNDYVDTDKTASDFGLCNNSAKSITAWVYTRSFNDGGIYEMGRHSNGRDFSLRTRGSDDQWRVQYWGSDSSTGNINFSFTSKNRWVHFAHVHDGARTKVYANGQPVVDKSRTLNTADKKTFKIGRWKGTSFDGIIDDVRIYNYALDADEILTIIKGGRAENPEPSDMETDAPHCGTLSWVAGAGASYHDVYFGTSYDAVANATTASAEYKGRQSDTSYVPSMKENTKYFWRINNIQRPFIWGKFWSFTTGENVGTITREVWTGIDGDSVSDLTGNSHYPDSPDIREEITSFEGPVDWKDKYGTRIHGFLKPPETGNYTFWIAGDNNSELWLSSDGNPVNQEKIAEVKDWTKSRQWEKVAEQKSMPIMLTAGQWYYIKALQKEKNGGDNIAVAWEMEGSCKGRQVISGSYLSGYDTDAPTPDSMTWAKPPHPTSSSFISMTATTALDISGVEYNFTCTSGGGHNSGWQQSATYNDSDLDPNTIYTYTVVARDKSYYQNITGSSPLRSARTFFAGDFEPDGDVDFADYSRFASYWPGAAPVGEASGSEADFDFDDDDDVDLEDLAILLADWLRCVEQP